MGFSGQYTEVVIIGAGIAGLSAAKTLKKSGVSFHVLEASHRLGGRAYSEEIARNNWFDLGCSYLHNGKINPFTKIASKINFPIDTNNGALFETKNTHYFSGGKQIYLSSPNPFDKANDRLLNKIGNLKTDRPLIDSMDINDPYFSVFCHLMGSLNVC